MADLNYKTFSSLMSGIKKPLQQYSANGLIKDANYINVARFVNAELGLKIHQQMEIELDVENHRAYLPDNCLSIIGAAAVVGREECDKIDRANFNLDIFARNRIKTHPLTPTRSSISRFTKNSLNRHYKSKYQIDINENELTFNFEEGIVALVYTADLIDEDGNLLVLDHPLINPYYEAAITAEILKDLWYNSDADTYNKYINERDAVLPPLRRKAQGIVNWPGYRKLKEYSERVNQEYYNKFMRAIV